MTKLLEYLPDEILLTICTYLSQHHIIRALYNLNYRFNCMISNYMKSFVISDRKTLDDGEYREVFSMVGPYLDSLTVKNTCLSPNEISLAPDIREITFIHAEIPLIPSLRNLTDLNIIYGHHSCQSLDFLFLTNNNLHSVYISSTNPIKIPTFSPRQFSAIKQLAITVQSFNDFIQLLTICPELTCLHLTLQTWDLNITETLENELLNETPSNLRNFYLRTAYDTKVSFYLLKCIFKHLTSKLERISIEIHTGDMVCIDGQLWENYLKENVPDLNVFEFFIELEREYSNGTKPMSLSDVLKTFQSLYWSSIMPQNINGYYNRYHTSISTCIHTEPVPTVGRRRYFLN